MRRFRRVAMASVASLVTIAACGGDDEETLPSGPSVTFATPSTTGAAATTSAASTSGAPSATASSAPATSEPAATASSAPPAPDTTGAPATGAPTPTEAAPGTTAAAPLGDPSVALSPVATTGALTDLAWRADDATMFVVEQDGRVLPLRDGALGGPLLDVTDETSGGGEQGLLGLTFSQDGSLAYVDYTDAENGDTHIAEYAVAADGTFDESSRRELLMIEQPYGNHNGGNVAIGPDGFLYIGMGDGGSGGDPERRALNVTTLLGKILRIDPAADGDQPYTIPGDNPFVGVDGARPEIWSVGVRNPWRMSFDRETGDLWFGDVGQGELEEIDVARAAEGAGRGFNFGWSAYEGTQRFNEDQSADGAIAPIFEYQHGDAGCSVSGGAVYRGAAIPALVGWYVYADYCSGTVFAIPADGTPVTEARVLAQSSGVSAVREGPDGELYVLSVEGTIEQIVAG